jgi:hypothetical protein
MEIGIKEKKVYEVTPLNIPVPEFLPIEEPAEIEEEKV